MAPSSAPAEQSGEIGRPILLNEKFKVHSYDGGCFKSRAQYDVKNALIPILEPFHCSGAGTKFNLVLKCSEDFTLTHFYVSGPGPRCSEPIRSGLVWVLDQPPEVDLMKKFDNMSTEELMEIMKGLHSYSAGDDKGLPDPCVYFNTDPTSRESEIELSRWREGKFVAVKFLDTHKDQENIDVGMIGLIGHFGRHTKQQAPFGPWMRRSVRQISVHPKPLKSMFSSSGWVCDGRDFTGGCRSGQTDFHQTSVFTVTFRCTTCAVDLCEQCAYDPQLGRVTEASVEADLEALAEPTMCKLAVTRLRNQWRRNWPETLPKYFAGGLLDVLTQALQKSTESTSRPDEDRIVMQTRQQSGAETQKRQVRRALLQLTMELTQRLLGIGPGGDINANDVVWALCTDPDEHWDEARVLQLPKAEHSSAAAAAAASGTAAGPSEAPATTAGDASASGPGEPAAGDAAESSGAAPADGEASASGATAGATSAPATGGRGAKNDDAAGGFLVSWRDGQPPSRVHPKNVWKMTADEDVMIATTSLFSEVCKGEKCDTEKVVACLKQGADLMATNGEGTAALLAAVRAGVPAEAVDALLENGAFPDAAGREGVTPLQHVVRLQKQRAAAGGDDPAETERLGKYADALRKAGASEPDDMEPAERLTQLRDTFGLKMVSSLLTLQSPLALPVEVLDVLFLLFRELPFDIVKRALEPQAFRSLTALFQHFVGGTDNLSTALVGCRIMRAVHSHPDPTLRYLVLSHGALRWAQRLASTKDVAQCGLYRQPHHDKVTPEELSREASALCEELRSNDGSVLPTRSSGEEWRGNARLVEVMDRLKGIQDSDAKETIDAAKEALFGFRELLKRTEKGAITDERCTAFELEQSGLPGELLRFLKFHAEPCPPRGQDIIRHPTMNQERWSVFHEVFSELTKQTRKGVARLMKALHAAVETGESFPVWRHRKERGLRALTEPVTLKLRPVLGPCEGGELLAPVMPQSMQSQIAVLVEPLVQVGHLSRYLLRITPTADARYLSFCHRLVGATVRDRASGERGEVVSFEVLNGPLPLPIHTIRRESTGDPQRVLLALCDYALVSPLSPPSPILPFYVALNRLQIIGGADAFPGLLRELMREIGAEPPSPRGADEAEVNASAAAQEVLREAAQAAAASLDEALAALLETLGGLAISGASADADGAASPSESGVDPTMRAHTVMITVSDEIPFELFWPMVREDIIGAVRELFPRAASGQMEQAVQEGVTQNGMGPIAQKLTLDEAETLAARVGHVVQTVVTVDAEAVKEIQKERAKTAQNEPIALAARVQFTPKTGEWQPGVVIGHGPPAGSGSRAGKPTDKFDIIDEGGILWEMLPRARVRIPSVRREAPGGLGAPIQAVLSQADLVRIREHLRRRQEEWAERHAQSLAGAASGAGGARGDRGGPGGVAGAGVGAPGGSGSGEPRTPGSRPTSAPDVLPQRQRAVSAGGLDASGPRRITGDLLSRDASLGDLDPSSALDMVHFMNEEGMGDDDFEDDDDGMRDPGDDGEEDDEDLQLLEPSEGGDSQGDGMPPPLGGLRSARDGESRGGDVDGVSSMEEEYRVLEQLRAMEQIISEVLDPHDGHGRSRRGEGGDDGMHMPMTNFRIRMGGGFEGRAETYQIRRVSGSRGSDRGPGGESHQIQMEPLRGDLPSFVRAADLSNPTSSLDHPVVERLGAADLVGDDEGKAEDEPAGDFVPVPGDDLPPQLVFSFCLQPPAEPTPAAKPSAAAAAGAAPAASGAEGGDAAAPSSGEAAAAAPPQPQPTQPLRPASTPIALPSSWNMLKAMQFLSDMNGANGKAAATGLPPFAVQPLHKVALDGWCLGYTLGVADDGPPTACGAEKTASPMDVDSSASQSPTRRKSEGGEVSLGAAAVLASSSGQGLPAKKRRRMGRADHIAREMYSQLTTDAGAGGDAASNGPHPFIAKCSDNVAVADAVELMHLLKAQGPDLGVEPSLWVSSKLDRKLRYQLEDPLSVVSGTLPLWATTLPRLCPFLFSLKTRKMLLKYTAFGPSFAIHWTQENKLGSFLRRRATVQTELNAQTDPRKMQELSQELSNIEEHVVKSNFWLGALQSTLVRMTKGDDFLRQSDVAMEIAAAAGRLLEVQFDGETGFGIAVTQSFYVEIAQALQERISNRRVPMWVEDDDSTNSQYLLCRRGLLIKPLLEGPLREQASQRFRALGRLMGHALREGFIVPIPLAEEVFSLVLGEPLRPEHLPRPGSGRAGEFVGTLADFAAELAASEAKLVAEAAAEGRTLSEDEIRAWRTEQGQRTDFGERFLHSNVGTAEESVTQEPMSFERYCSLVEPCFMENGLSGAPLCPDGDNKPVTLDNIQEFVDLATRFWYGSGVSAQVGAFRDGLNDVFPLECLVTFSPVELREMFCGEDRIEWTEEQLLNHLHPGGGLTDKSSTYKFLVAELLEMNQAERSRFLDFVSSCPRLPPGGIAKFHVDVFPDTCATKQGFPRSRACANQLYLPPYSTKDELHSKLHEAMHCSVGHHEQRVRDL